MTKPTKTTPPQDNVETPILPPAATDGLAEVLARLESLEADKVKLQAENEALKAAVPSKEDARDAVARQLANAAFQGSPYASVAPNINASDYETENRKPVSEVDVHGEMPVTVDGVVKMVPYTNKIRTW